MTYDVTVIGEIYQDHVFSGFASWPAPGEETFTDHYEWELGGGAVITACALARLGRSVQLIGVAGHSDMPRISERLADFGVSSSQIVVSELRTGVTVSLSTIHDRSFFTYQGANGELAPRLMEDAGLLLKAAAARHVHIAMPLSAGLAAKAVPILRSGAATLSLDVGHHVGWLQDEASLGVLSAIDYSMPNAKEATLLSGGPPQYLEQCRGLGLRHALVKLGRDGAVLLHEDVEYRALSPDVAVVDTTGAGDVFDAGFIDALLSSASPQAMLEQACACGAMSTRAAGALRALPTREEIVTMLQETYVS